MNSVCTLITYWTGVHMGAHMDRYPASRPRAIDGFINLNLLAAFACLECSERRSQPRLAQRAH